MVEIIATVESIEQAKQLLPYVDTIFFSEKKLSVCVCRHLSHERNKAN